MALITREENNGFRVIKALMICGKQVLYNTFLWGTPNKPLDMRLLEYLKNLTGTSSANYVKDRPKGKLFDSTQRELINKNPDGSKFDVSLLYRSIRLACENVAPFSDSKWFTPSTEMEYYITAIKNMKNDALHGQLAVSDEGCYKNMEKLRELLIGCLKTSGKRYAREEAELYKKIKEVNDKLDIIMNEIIGEEDIRRIDDIKYCNIVIENRNKLKEIFQAITYSINPVTFITNNLQLKEDKIFVDVAAKEGKNRRDNKHIDYRDLLELVQTTPVPSSVSSAKQQGSSARPQILLLKGVTGSGKTTLVKLVTQEWIQGGQDNIRGIDNYQLLLWVECSDPAVNSYQDLLDLLIPDAAIKFRNILTKIVKFYKILIVVDGLDELYYNSKTLVTDLLYEFRNSVHATFICTSRPEKVTMLMKMIPEEYNVTLAELRGINKEHMEEYVRWTHREMSNFTKSKSTDELVNKVMKVKGLTEYLCLPMNLTFFVYILVQEPDELNITITLTEFFHKIHHMCQSKLLERLVNCSETKTKNKSDLQCCVQVILKIIYAASLESLSRDQLNLEEKTINQLISVCNEYNISYQQILYAFLSLKRVWTLQGIKELYSAPHKGIQEYYSALHILMTLKHQLQTSVFPVTLELATPTLATPVSIRGVLKQSVASARVDMTKYHSVLIHVAGLLHLVLDQVPEVITYEVARLLHESGMKNNDHWLNVLENTRCNENIAKAIAPFISTGNIYINDHRTMSCYTALLPHLTPSKVHINISGERADMPGLLDLLAIIAQHHLFSPLELHHCCDTTTATTTAITATTSDAILQHLQPQ